MHTWRKLLLFILIGIGISARGQTPAANAASLSKDIARLEGQIKSRPDSLLVRQVLAEKYLMARQPDKTIEILNPFTDRVSVSALLNLASAYHEKKDHVNEIRILLLASQKEDKNPKIFYALGKAQLEIQKDVDGVMTLRKAMQLNDRYLAPQEELRQYFLRNNSRYEARELLHEMIKTFGLKPDYQNDLCKIYSADSFAKEAVKECRRAIELSKNNPDNYVYLAQTLMDSEQAVNAEKVLVSSAEKFPQSEFVQWATGQNFLKKNLYPVAARYFAKALKAKPDSVRSLIGNAQAELQNGNFNVSYDMFFKACTLDPKTVAVFQEATATLRQKGNETWVRKFNQGGFACRARDPKG